MNTKENRLPNTTQGKARHTPGPWISTDPDTAQFGRYLSSTAFEFRENKKEQKVIELNEYTFKQIREAMDTYGYEDLDSITGMPIEWIIAECLYEMDVEGTAHAQGGEV